MMVIISWNHLHVLLTRPLSFHIQLLVLLCVFAATPSLQSALPETIEMHSLSPPPPLPKTMELIPASDTQEFVDKFIKDMNGNGCYCKRGAFMIRNCSSG